MHIDRNSAELSQPIFLNLQFLKFLLSGGTAALVNLVGRYVLNFVMPFEAAVVAAYFVGMIVAYMLMSRFVFGTSGRSVGSELRRFVLVNLVAFTLVWAISVGLARVLFPEIGLTWHADDIAHFIGVSVPAVTSYIGHRFYTFARRES